MDGRADHEESQQQGGQRVPQRRRARLLHLDFHSLLYPVTGRGRCRGLEQVSLEWKDIAKGRVMHKICGGRPDSPPCRPGHAKLKRLSHFHAVLASSGFGSSPSREQHYGVYNSAVAREPPLNPPETRTLPLFSRVALWYRRAEAMAAAVLQVPEAGSYSSAVARKP